MGRASKIVSSSLRLWETIKSGNLPLETSRDKVQCMTSYWRVFGTCRIPLSGRDKLFTCPTSKHIVVLVRNLIYTLYVYDNDGIPSSPESIEKALSQIQDDAQGRINDDAAHGGFGIWTCENRDSWTSIRKQVIENETNKKSIHQIDTAIMVVCLDDMNIIDEDHRSGIMLHGNNGENRWFDKLQLIVLKDGSASFNMEHAPHDGHTLLMCATYIFDDIHGKLIPGSSSKSLRSDNLPHSQIILQLNSELKQSIKTAKENMKKFVAKTQSCVLEFNDFGSSTIKKLKVSPDAFVQMAYQIAYYKMTGTVQSTYESCNMKGYYHGRTECIRSTSSESKLMCETFIDKNASTSTKAKLIRSAAERHVKTGSLAKKAKGADRHLLGLQTLARHRQILFPHFDIPEIFTDSSYPKFCGSILSTSNCGGYALDLFGFGPVMPTGLGLGYIVKPDCLLINVTSFIGKAHEYSKLLRETFLEMYSVCNETVPQLQSKL